MPSPFPGMDPYLEPHWLDVHTALIGEARRTLNRSLPAGLVARAEERLAVEAEDDGVPRQVGPDLTVVAPPPTAGHDAGAIVIDAPFRLVLDPEPAVERYLRVLADDGRVIAVIEFVSPANKRPPGLRAFRTKREELLTAGVHFVEIDLVRAGDWRALMRPETCPPEAVCPYRATVRTAGPRPAGYLFPVYFDRPLPDVPVPLRPSDAPATLPLREMLDAVYADGRYDATLDYNRDLDPPLSPDDAARVGELLRAAGKTA